MMVSKEAVKLGVANYFATECASKSVGLGQFASYFLLPSIPNMVDKYIKKMEDSELFEDVIHDNMVDIDLVESRAREAMKKCGTIEVMGYRLNHDDASLIADYVRRAYNG